MRTSCVFSTCCVGCQLTKETGQKRVNFQRDRYVVLKKESILWVNPVLVTCSYEQRQWAKALTVNPMVFWEMEQTSMVHSEYHNVELGWERQVWYMLKTQTRKPLS